MFMTNGIFIQNNIPYRKIAETQIFFKSFKSVNAGHMLGI